MTYPTTFELPTTDKLTGLLSSMYFRHLLREQIIPQAEASGDPLSLALLDLDGLMSIHKHNHEHGDQMLKQVGQLIQETMPETAIVSRYGWDDFAIALPDMMLDDAFTLMEEFRRRVAGLKFEMSPEYRITCSIGLADFPSHGNNDVILMRAADQALYKAKTTGRNKVALPLIGGRMVTKTSYYTTTQLQRLAELGKTITRKESILLREALDDLLKKYNDRLSGPSKK